jgi:gluconolactonase
MELSQTFIGAIISLLLITSCSSESREVAQQSMQHTVIDFTDMGIFTSGIEGPAIDSKGRLFVVNYKEQGTIGLVDKKGDVTNYLTLPEGSIGNSIQFDKGDTMYVADYAGHVIYKISPGKVIDTLIHHSRFNQPNDIALAEIGVVYASDPNWLDNTGQLWLIKQGKAVLQEDNMGTTNGMALNLDESKLYVNESVQRNVWVYSIDEEGELSNKILFHHFEDKGMDGMKIDSDGNLYIARYGAGVIVVLSPNGEVINSYNLKGKFPTNLVFSEDGNSIFVTLQKRKGIEQIILNR